MTESAEVLPVTGFGAAEAGIAIVGAEFGGVTVTCAVALREPVDAVTVADPAVVPALKRPDAPIEPAPPALQVNVGCVIIGVEN
jgi:hypothetical protein